ncbi:MAG: DUF1501 domain-containing protein [Saprospiraceae bacterium]
MVTVTHFATQVVANAWADNGSNKGGIRHQWVGLPISLSSTPHTGWFSTPRLYMVVHDGFDTHANQSDNHPQLIQQLSRAVQNINEDLANDGDGERTLSMTFSEFGRRIEQNASGGTDHGTAAPLFLFGEGLNGNGLLGRATRPMMTMAT